MQPVVRRGAVDDVHPHPGRAQLLAEPEQRRRAVATRHEQARHLLPRHRERGAERADDVQLRVERDVREPGRARPVDVVHDLDRAPVGARDRERTAQQRARRLDTDADELPRTGPLGDLRGSQREHPVRPLAAMLDDLEQPLHGTVAVAARDRAQRVSRCDGHAAPPSTGGGARSTTRDWNSCSEVTVSGPEVRASMPWIAARMPASVVMHGTPLVTAASRIS